jgi:hypothetical protein
MPPPLEVIVDFLRTLGIATAEGHVPAGSFLPGIRVAGGRIIYDPATLRWPGDLLHEAGHLAVLPAALRSRLDDALPGIDDIPHAGEPEATAWAYAAIVHLRLDPAVLFHEGGYRGRSQDLIRTFGFGVYPGAHGLAQAGMTLTGQDALRAGVAPYPRMARWLRE